MKKQKLLVLTLAAIMAIGLGACGGNGGDVTSSAFDYGQVEAQKISFNRNTVYELGVGETLDLAEFVTVSPEDAKWNVVALDDGQSDCVKIEGTTITGIAPGEFKVRIMAGSNSAVKNYAGTVVSPLLKKTRQMIESMEAQNYTVALLDTKKNDAGEYDIFALGYHNAKYFAFADETGISGLMKSGKGHTLEFTYEGAGLDIDPKTYLPFGGELSVPSGYQPDLSLYTMTMPLGFDGSEFSDTDEGDIEVSKGIVEKLLSITIGVDYAALQQEMGTVSGVYLDFPNDGENALIGFYDKANKPICNLWVGNFGTTSIAEVDKYIADKTEPEQPTFDAFDAYMKDANEKKNMTVEGAVKVGYHAQNGKWVDATNAQVLSNFESNWGTAPGTYTAKVDGESLWTIDNSSKGVEAYTIRDNQLYSITGVPNESGYEYTTSPIDSFGSIWDEGLAINNDGIVSPAGFTTVDLNEENLSLVAWSSVAEKAGVYTATASPYGDFGYFMSCSIALVPQIGYFYANLFSGLYSPDFEQIVWYDFLENTEVTLDTVNGTCTIANELQSMVSSGNIYYGVRFEVTIKDVGTTEKLDSFMNDVFNAPVVEETPAE